MSERSMAVDFDEICDDCGARMGDHRLGGSAYHPNPVNVPLRLIQPGEKIRVRYRNWRDETRERRIELDGVAFWGKTDWHPTPQWLVTGTDMDSGEHRVWTLADMVPLNAPP